ncbi:hypothetical protein, partial [Roseibium sp. RKSG952]|uniref:hypothetical protein n=1 Tax=Roseibium sp. RKSG952 TaxID=2529384 RepID=UPI001AD8E7B3
GPGFTAQLDKSNFSAPRRAATNLSARFPEATSFSIWKVDFVSLVYRKFTALVRVSGSQSDTSSLASLFSASA